MKQSILLILVHMENMLRESLINKAIIDSFSKVLLLDFWYRLTIQTNKSARLNNGVRKDVTQFPINIFVFEFAFKQQRKM